MHVIKAFQLMILAHLFAACATFSFRDANEPRPSNGSINVEAYEDYLVRHPFGLKSDTKRFQLAMTYLDTQAMPHDSAKARNHLWQLEGSAVSPYREAAAQVLTMLKEVERLRGESTVASQHVERMRAEAMRLRGVVEVAESRIAEQNESASRLQVELQSAYGKLRRMGDEGASQKQEIERLTRELSELKRIDTRQVQ